MSLTEKLIRTLVAVVMVPGLLAGASWAAPVTTNLQVNYDPSSMVGSGANSNPDWNDTTASAVHMDNLPTFTLNASPTGAPAAITQSFTITGGQANNVDQVAGGADDWDEALAGNYQQYSASLEFWLQPANITQDRRVIYEIGGGSGMGMFQDDQWLEFAVTTNGREWVAVDLTNVPGLGDISSDWFQALGVIDKVNKKVSLYINGVHIADSNLGGSANGVAIKRGSSTTDTEWGSLNWSGGDAQALGDASTNANVAPNKNMGGYGNKFTFNGPSDDNDSGLWTSWAGDMGVVRLYGNAGNDSAALTLSQVNQNYESVAGQVYNDWDFEQGAGDGNWDDATWDMGHEPTATEFARIIGDGTGPDTVTVNTAGNVAETLAVGTSGDGAGKTILQVDGGAGLTIGQDLILGLDGTDANTNQVIHDGGTVTVTGDLVYGLFGAEGGEYHLNGGTLTVTNITEAFEDVNGALFCVDGGTLNLGGNILVESFRTGDSAAGAFTLGTGQSLETTGTFYAGRTADGDFTNAGGDVTIGDGLQVAHSALSAGSSYVQTGGSTTIGASSLGMAIGVVDAGVVTVSGGDLVSNGDIHFGASGGAGTLNILGTGDVTANGNVVFGGGGGGGAGTLDVSGGTMDVMGDMSVVAGDSGALNLTGGELYFDAVAPTSRDVSTMTFDNDGVLRLRVDPTPGDGVNSKLHTPVNVTGTADVDPAGDSAPQVVLDLTPTASADDLDKVTWTDGANPWDADGSRWDAGVLPAEALDYIDVGDTLDVITAGTLTGNPLNVVGNDANWQSATSGNTLQLKRINEGFGFGPVKAVIDGAGSDVTRTTDLLVAGVPQAALGAPDAANLEILNGASLNLVGGDTDLIIDGDNGNERSDQDALVGTGSDLTIDRNLIFGGAVGADGGTFRMTGGTVTVHGNIVEGLADGTRDESVKASQFFVDGGTLSVDGDILIRSFRVGDEAGYTGSYTLLAGKLLDNSGWLQVGAAGDGTLINDGGTIKADKLIMGKEGATSRGTYTQTGGSATIVGNGVDVGGSADSTGNIFTLEDGTFTTTGGFYTANGTGSDGTVTIGKNGDSSKQPILTVSGGNLELVKSGTGVVDMYGGTVYLNSDNLIPTQSAGSDGTTTLHDGVVDLRGSGGDRTTGDLNFNKGTGRLTVGSDATLYVSGKTQMTDDAAAVGIMTIDGDVYVRTNWTTRNNGNDTINLSSGGSLVFGNDLGLFAGGSPTSTLTFGTGTNTFNWTGGMLAGLDTVTGVATNLTGGAIHQQGGTFVVSAGTTTIDGSYTIEAGATIQAFLPVGATGAAIQLTDAAGIATFPTLPDTYNMQVEPVDLGDPTDGAAVTFDNDGGSATWDGDATNWTTDRLPSAAKTNVNGSTWTLVDTQQPLVGDADSPALAGWTLDDTADGGNDLTITRTADLYAGAVRAIIDGAVSSPVARHADLHIHDGVGTSFTPADAAALEIKNSGTLVLNPAATTDLILGGAGMGLVIQDGDLNVGGDVRFGTNPYTSGGEYYLNGGTLTVGGAIVEVDPDVDQAQFYVDGGALNVTGNITVQSFRTGMAVGSNGAYTLPAGKTLENTGTFYVGYDGTGTFTVGGGVLNVENRIELGGSNEVDPGDGTTITSAGSGSLLVTSGTINENNSGIYVGVAEESTGNLFEMTGGTVTTGGNGLDMAKGANSDATVNIKDGSLIINDGGFFMAMGTGSSTTVQIGYADGSGNPSVYVGDDNYEIGNKGTAVYTQWSGSVVQDGGSGTDNLVVTQDAGSDGTFNLYGGVFDLRAPGDQAGDTNGEVNFNRGVGTATIEGRNGQTARLYVPNKFQLTNQSTGASIVNIDTGGEVHVQGGIDYRSGGMVDAVNLKGGLLNFYGDGATIDQRDLDDQFNWTGGRMQNLTTWNGHQGGAAYVQEDLGKGGDREGVLGDASPTATTGAGSGTAGGLLFDGDQDYVNFGNGVNMFNGQSEVALSIWFRRDGDQATQTNHNINNVLVAQSGGGSNNDNFEIGSDGDNIEFYLDVGSGPANETMSVDTSGAGGIGTTWHHVVLSYDGTAGLDVWFDNNQILTGDTSFSGAFAASGSNAPLTLGIARPGSDDWGDFLGAMDEFAFWHETLDAAGVADLYNGGSGNQLAAALATAEFYASLDTVYISQWLQQDAGVMAPGASIGTTTVNDNYDVGNNDPATATTSADPLAAVWEIELDPDTAIGSAGGRTQYDADFIDVNGTLTLAADSVLSLIDITGSDFAGLTSDHVFIIAEYDELDGTFGAVEGLPASLVDYNFDDANQIAIMPEPATLALTGLGATATLLARRRRRRA